MLRKLVEYRPITTLIPDSGIQFLDFAFDVGRVAKVSRTFWPEIDPSVTDAEGRPRVTLHLVEHDDDGNPYCQPADRADRIAVPDEECYSVRAVQALEALANEWLPLPILRVLASGTGLDDGPTNWSRLQIVPLGEPDADGHTHRLVIAIDTAIIERKGDSPYAAPDHGDVTEDVDFAIAASPTDNRPFLALDWVAGWLRDAFVDGMSRRRGRKMSAEDIVNPGEFWAHFIVALEAAAQACAIPRLRLVDTMTKALQTAPIDVDLAIDVGNSRTCGILIEQSKQIGSVDISRANRLVLRDLSRPEHSYDEPFESRVEFAAASFGRREHSRRSGRRRDAFWWPSPVRIGPEASWLASLSDGTEGGSGLSSPKRYLWDEAARPQPWTNNRGLLPATAAKPSITGPMIARLTETGDLVGPNRPVGMVPRYSRSSLFTLMLAELLIHAVAQINNPAARIENGDADVPRRLRSFILTLPSATPVAEQRILRKRAEDAVRLVRQTMGWKDDDPLHPPIKPKLDWDEATCTHLVYLYSEINKKFRGNPTDLFGLTGRRRGNGDTPSLRVASLDIGGGTTDLMIIQHEIDAGEQRTVHPRQMFREGFRQAGDDVLKQVIEDIVLMQLRERFKEAGVAVADTLVSELFGSDRVGLGQQDRLMRSLLTSQILVPIGLALLGAYEKTDRRRERPPVHIRLADALPPDRSPSKELLAYLEKRIRAAGGEPFDILTMDFEMEAATVEGAVRQVMGAMIEDLCDVVRSYDCDVFLLSGRPSRFPLIRDLVVGNLPIRPDRIVLMHDYKVHDWYPFAAPDQRIGDPKTTAVVGALLCQICEGLAPGFLMRASEIKMKSTARFIGVMEHEGQILERNCLLTNADLDTGANVVDFTVSMEAPVFIGFRQLPYERWKTTPLYYLHFTRPEKVPTLLTPLRVTLERSTPRDEEDETVMEDFKIRDVEDRDGSQARSDVAIRLQTLRPDQQADGGYWLDTGILRTTDRF